MKNKRITLNKSKKQKGTIVRKAITKKDRTKILKAKVCKNNSRLHNLIECYASSRETNYYQQDRGVGKSVDTAENNLINDEFKLYSYLAKIPKMKTFAKEEPVNGRMILVIDDNESYVINYENGNLKNGVKVSSMPKAKWIYINNLLRL